MSRCEGFPTFREITPFPFSGYGGGGCGGGLVAPIHQHTLKVEMELVPETSENLHILTRLLVPEKFSLNSVASKALSFISSQDFRVKRASCSLFDKENVDLTNQKMKSDH